MKRPITLIAGILGTALLGLWVCVMLIGISAILDLLAGLGTEVQGDLVFAVVAFLEMGLGITALVLNAVSISAFKASAEKYSNKKGTIITAVVFNLILALILLISLMQTISAINALVFLGLVAASVLYIVDLCLEGKRIKAAEAAAPAAPPAPPAPPAAPAAPAAPAEPKTDDPSTKA